MQRSKLDMGGADAGAGGMSISSSSGGASGMGASSSSSAASAMAQSTGSSRAGSGSTHVENSSPSGVEFGGVCDGSFETRRCCVLVSDLHPVVHAWFFSQRSVTARAAHSAEDWRRHALFMAKPSKEPSRTVRASVALACAWMQLLKLRKTATSQGCQVRRALWQEEAQHDVRESGPHGCQCGLAGVDAGHVPLSPLCLD